MTRRNADPATFTRDREFLSFAERGGCKVRQTGSSHVIVTAPNGHIGVIPCGHGEIPKGTRRSILRMFARMGLLAALVVAVLAAWVGVFA